MMNWCDSLKPTVSYLIPSVPKLPTCSKHCCKTACTQWTPQELWMSCGIWRQDIRSRSFKSSSCEVGPPWIRPSSRCSDWDLGSGEPCYPAEKGQFHKETPLPWRGVCGLQQSLDRWCQYNIPMNASTVSRQNIAQSTTLPPPVEYQIWYSTKTHTN